MQLKIYRNHPELNLCSLVAVLVAALSLALHLAANDNSTEAERRSSFQIKDPVRNPFWPLGWTPSAVAAPAAPTPAPTQTISPESFNVSLISLGPPHIAVINGKDYSENSKIPVSTAGGVVEVRVMAIRDGFVLLEHNGQPIHVKLRR